MAPKPAASRTLAALLNAVPRVVEGIAGERQEEEARGSSSPTPDEEEAAAASPEPQAGEQKLAVPQAGARPASPGKSLKRRRAEAMPEAGEAPGSPAAEAGGKAFVGGGVRGAPVGRSLKRQRAEPAPAGAESAAMKRVECVPIPPLLCGGWGEGAEVCMAPADRMLQLHCDIQAADRALRPSDALEATAAQVLAAFKDMLDEVFVRRVYLNVEVLSRDERAGAGLVLANCDVEGVAADSCWARGGLAPGMTILAVNGAAATSAKDVVESLSAAGTTMFTIEVDVRAPLATHGAISEKVTLRGSWASGSHMRWSSPDVAVDVPRNREWTSRLLACVSLRYHQAFAITAAKGEEGTAPDLLITHKGSGLTCKLYLAQDNVVEGVREAAAQSLAPECKITLRVLKALNRLWGSPATSYQLVLLVQAYYQTALSTDIGWMNDTGSLGAVLLGLLHWYGAVFDWATGEACPTPGAAGVPGFRPKGDAASPYVVVCPATQANVVADRERFAAFLKYTARTAAVLANKERTLDHVLPRACCT
eukprot:TRINITY_DN18374_c0_g1_i1.p1 TRINITY_DN18374_c0_g1~~TRINITY_DN18374_c0_g1_i1.p1  ORF type:complete len:617 (+),score=132.18 TRINITY_DN18374_c0_g1_i1:244-1851(+)